MGTVNWIDMPHVEMWYGDEHTFESTKKIRDDISKEIMAAVIEAVDMYELPNGVRISIQ